MRKEVYILSILVLSLFLISCAVPEVPESPPTPAPQPSTPRIEPPAIEKVITAVYVRDIGDLLAKSREEINYRYFFDAGQPLSYDVFVMGSKIKKVYQTPRKLNAEVFYNNVYLDVEARTAVTTCTEPGVLCGPTLKKIYSTAFGQEMVDPVLSALITNVPYNAKVVGTEVFDNHNALIIEYQNTEGLREQLSLDTYSGFPIRQRIFNSDDDRSVVEHHTFTKLGVGNVLEEDVTLPEDYSVVE